ncbi:MAG: hypothetical protein IPM20_12380 [Gammaproteobacteria bacterium]|nr:hypothetical protein [Gammaproteobacteria bacterium]
MKRSFCLMIILLSGNVLAYDDDEVPIDNSTQLREWCKSESEAYFIAQDIEPRNWSASYWDEGNILNVKGSWRVGDKNVEVQCRIRRGAQTKYAMLQIMDE